MRQQRDSHYYYSYLTILCVFMLHSALLIGCQNPTNIQDEKTHKPGKLLGTWTLAARIQDGQELPATQRVMRLTFSDKGTFTAEYRADSSQPWIRPGKGVFRYASPTLSLYWDSGAVSTLLVTEMDQERILVHHGRNLVPLKDQEPGEIFQRQRMEKGPTRAAS
jgi:hypothetical protein